MTQGDITPTPELVPGHDAPDLGAGWSDRSDTEPWYDTFPWWMILVALILLVMGLLIIFDEGYNTAFDRIIPGIGLTIKSTLFSFVFACALGLILAIGRTSRNVVARNLSRTYVEFIRGIPMLVLIFTIALVIAPSVADALPQWFIDLPIVSYFFDDNGTFKQEWRAITALSLIYGGYIAEIFRAGIESVDRGQVEAGRSLGLTRRQTSRAIVLPQALRAVVPPLGNDFIAVLKDTSLLSAVGVLEITLRARQYSAGSFKFRDSYLALTFIYLSLTVVLSLVLTVIERRMHRDRRGERM